MALEDIKERIDAEIEARKLKMRLKENMQNIGASLKALEYQTNQFAHHDDNEEREKQDRKIKNYRILKDTDPVRASELIDPKANLYVTEWALDPVPQHQETVKEWDGFWKTNKELEEAIMKETKWYKMDLNLKLQQHRFAMDNLKSKVEMQLEAMSAAMTDLKLQKQLEIERLQMTIEDYEAEKLKSQQSLEQDGAASEFVLEFIQSGPRLSSVKEYKDYLDALKTHVHALYYSNKLMREDYGRAKVENDQFHRRLNRLELENEAK